MRAISFALVLGSTLLLSGCGTIDLASIGLPSITLPWETQAQSPAPETAALREDAGEVAVDGLQVEDLRVPFGAQPAQVATLSGSL